MARAAKTAAPDDTGEQQTDTKFKPGQSGNPDGRPKGSRNKLADAFVTALHDSFLKDGVAAIDNMRAADPGGYVRVIASLLPKEFKIETTSDLTDEQLDARIRTLAGLLEVGVAGAADRGEAPEGPTTAH